MVSDPPRVLCGLWNLHPPRSGIRTHVHIGTHQKDLKNIKKWPKNDKKWPKNASRVFTTFFATLRRARPRDGIRTHVHIDTPSKWPQKHPKNDPKSAKKWSKTTLRLLVCPSDTLRRARPRDGIRTHVHIDTPSKWPQKHLKNDPKNIKKWHKNGVRRPRRLQNPCLFFDKLALY